MEKRKTVKKSRGHARTIRVGAINITTHPHSPQGYLDLLNAIYKVRQPVKIQGKHHAHFGRMTPLSSDPLDGVTGEFHKYFNLDVDGKWFNVEDLKAANERDVAKINIPDNLKPDFEGFRYVFFPKSHRLFFEVQAYRTSQLSPRHVEKLLTTLFSLPSIVETFGEVDVVIEPEAEKLEEILAMHRLRRLEIQVTRPNQDELSKAEKEVFRRLDEEFAVRETTILHAQPGKSLKPNNDTRTVARVAASNGKVIGEGTNENNRAVKESTQDHPWIEARQYHPSVENEFDVFVEKAKSMLASLRARVRRAGN